MTEQTGGARSGVSRFLAGQRAGMLQCRYVIFRTFIRLRIIPVLRLNRYHALFAAVLLFFFLSGACGLLYQVVWTRKLVLLFGTTAYAVSTVLSIFFLGLGVGSLWGGRLADRTANPLRLYGFFEMLIGLWAVLFIAGINYGEGGVVFLLKAFGFSHGMGILLRGVLAALFLFVPVSLMGATLPLLAKFVNREAQIHGLRIGFLYTLNTLGAVAGCFTTGFVLIEHFGYTQTTLIGAAANGVIGLLAVALAQLRFAQTVGQSASEESVQAAELEELHLSTYLRQLPVEQVPQALKLMICSGRSAQLDIIRARHRERSIVTARFEVEGMGSILIGPPSEQGIDDLDELSHEGVENTPLYSEAEALAALERFYADSPGETFEASFATDWHPLALPPGEAALSGFRLRIALLAFAISGFSMLAMEVLWTRLLAMAFLGTTYAYTTMLTALLMGIVIGSAVCSSFVDRLRKPMWGLGLVMMLTGIGCLWTTTKIAGLPEQVSEIAARDWDTVVQGIFSLSFFALFVPTFFSGMTFPLAVKAVGQGRERLGRDLGVLYSANTFGGVLGALAGGYLLIPWLGTHYGIVFLSALLLVAGAITLLACPRTPVLRCGWLTPKGKPVAPWLSSVPSSTGTMIAIAMAVLLCGLVWRNTPQDVSRALNAGYIPKDHRVLHYREGVEGTVAVSEPEKETNGTNRVLWINRVQATASIEKGVKMNRFQGTLPLLFDRDPKEVLFMCFGSGVTCGTLALSAFERIDAVEICQDVLHAAPLFAVDNRDVLHRPAVQFHIDDGRNHLLTTPNKYDVITFEPMPLALAGVSTFYTQEYYQLCLAHLKPGGLVSQWVPMHSLNSQVVRSLVRTFTSVFPEYAAFFINADVFLIGSNAPLRLDWAKAEARLAAPELHAALEAVNLGDPVEILASFLMDKAQLAEYGKDGSIMSDDRPWAEFEAPKLVYQRTVQQTLIEAAPYFTSPFALLDAATLSAATREALERRHAAHRNDFKALQAYYGGMTVDDSVLEGFLGSLDIDPNDANAQYYVRQIIGGQAELRMRWEQHKELLALLDKALQRMPGDPELTEWVKKAQEDQQHKVKEEKK